MNEELIQPILIEPSLIAADVLQNILQEYTFREGTNYGDVEHSLETKVAQLLKQLQKGEIVLVFDPETESVNLMTKYEFQKMNISREDFL